MSIASPADASTADSVPSLTVRSDPYLVLDGEGAHAWGMNLDVAERGDGIISLRGWSVGFAAIEVWAEDRRLAATRVFSPRHDVVQALGGRLPPELGFQLEFASDAPYIVLRGIHADGEAHEFLLTEFDVRADDPASACLGVIERIEDNVIYGWVYPGPDSQPPEVDIEIGGRQIGAVTCAEARDDLRLAGFGDGRYGFRFLLPEREGCLSMDSLKLLYRGRPVALGALPTPVFSSLEATRCLSGVVELVWPYCVSGQLEMVRQVSSPVLQIHLGERVVATAELRWEYEVQGGGFGVFRLVHLFAPADRGTSPEPVWLVLPGVGKVLLGTSTPLLTDEGGRFEIRDNTLEGQLSVAASAPPTLRARVLVDHRTHCVIDVRRDEPGGPRFSVKLPNSCFDGAEHIVAVVNEGVGACLRSPDSGSEILHRFPAVGTLDGWESPFIRGWAFDLCNIGTAAIVELYEGDERVATVECSDRRDDASRLLKLAAPSGFALPVPAHLYDGRRLRLSVRCNGVCLAPGNRCQLPEQLTPADLAAVPPASRTRGRIEQVSCRVVAGWAWDVLRPEVPVELAIKVDGELVGTTFANQFSARLRQSGRSGHQQFQFWLPDWLMNGARRTLSVHDVASGLALPCASALDIEFPLTRLPPPPVSSTQWQSRSLPVERPGRERAVAFERPQGAPLVSVIVLNLDGAHLLGQLFESMAQWHARPDYELIVVDHGSTDRSLEIIRDHAERLPIILIDRGRNHSFSESNNFAARIARGAVLVFANNDLVLHSECLGPLCERLRDPSVGIVGTRLLEPMRTAVGWDLREHHEGVRFRPQMLAGADVPYYSPHETVGVQHESCQSFREVPVVTAALMACRKPDFLALGGFCEDYRYGLEDVDFCLKMRNQLGLGVFVDLSVTAIHNRSATREEKFSTRKAVTGYTRQTHAGNQRAYLRRYGRDMVRTILRALVAGDTFYRTKPLRVALVVTEADAATSAGDYFTALELGEALRERFGFEIFFCAYKNIQLPDIDVAVVMRHDYELRRVSGVNPGFIAVAWVRNRVDEWLAREEFPDYHLVAASSNRAVEHIRALSGRSAFLLPIATNPARFKPEPAAAQHAADLVFTGSFHGAVRGAAMMASYVLGGHSFAIYGHHWAEAKRLGEYWRGSLSYDALKDAYNGARLVLDDGHPVTRDWASLNSRVFDALACGKLVLTNCVEGSNELFDGMLPTFGSVEELGSRIKTWLGDDDARERLAAELRQAVLDKHTYAHRAETLQQQLSALLDERVLRIAIKIGVPRAEEIQQWGDYHFALGLKRALERQGHVVRIDILPDWYGGLSAGDDVVLVLRGLSRYQPKPNVLNLMWLISHPDEVSVAEMREYDHVFVASDPHARALAGVLGTRISCLPQCTDPDVFRRDQRPGLDLPPILFVGNSRAQFRRSVRLALEAGLDFGVIGSGWAGLVPAARWIAEHVANGELRAYYSSVTLVLNDHWDDMRDRGFASNRLFDVGACETPILTDRVEAAQALFPDAGLVYDTDEDFVRLAQSVLDDPQRFQAAARARAQHIRAAHSFDDRVATLLSTLAALRRVQRA